MSFFINYNAEDILKQATESTLRYEQGTFRDRDYTYSQKQKAYNSIWDQIDSILLLYLLW